MFVKFVVLLSSALFVSGAPHASVSYKPNPMLDGRIVGGSPIDIKEVPYQVSMRRSGVHLCGGSIIGKKWILTAGHCTQAVNNNPKTVTVNVGSSEKAKGGVSYKVKRIFQNKMYNPRNIDYDYALLELESSIEFNEKAQPIKLVEADQVVRDETKCLVTGWGNTQSTDSSNKLRGTEVPVVNQEKCTNYYENTNGITPRMICAGLEEGGKDSCQGDSGGPLVIFDETKKNPVQIGIVSWGYGCAQPSYPGVYARITAGRKWIAEVSGI